MSTKASGSPRAMEMSVTISTRTVPSTRATNQAAHSRGWLMTSQSSRIAALWLLLLLSALPAFAQLGTVAPPFVFQGVNATGGVCASCRLFFYACGTTTNQTVYSDSALSTAHSQPITLNAAGRPANDAGIYLTPGVCTKAVLKTSADAEIWSKDNVGPGHGVGNDRLRLSPHSVTIATGTITATFSYYEVDTESAAATDNLDTITAGVGVGEGSILVLTPANVARVVTVRDRGGNVALQGGSYALQDVGSALTLLYDGSNWVELARADGGVVTQTTTDTGTTNNFALSRGVNLLRSNNASLLTLTGLVAGYDGQVMDLVSIGAGQVDLANQNAGSTAVNRIITGPTGTVSLAAGVGRARLRYDATTARWRVIEHEQGAWITPTFAAGNFTASTGDWTVDSADVTTHAYYLRGRTLTLSVVIQTTDVNATPADLQLVIPGGFTAAKQVLAFVDLIDAGTRQYGLARATAASTTVAFSQGDAGNFTTTSSDNTYVRGQITFEVQ